MSNTLNGSIHDLPTDRSQLRGIRTSSAADKGDHDLKAVNNSASSRRSQILASSKRPMHDYTQEAVKPKENTQKTANLPNGQISNGIEPFLVTQIRTLVAAKNAQASLQLPFLRDILDVPAETPQVEQPLDVQHNIDLQTSEDAIKFFIEHGQNSPLKFVYCNRSDGTGSPMDSATAAAAKVDLTKEKSRELAIAKLSTVLSTAKYSPYELTITSRKTANPQYYTVSASGVVSVCKGEPSETYTLTEWLHESSTFNTLRSINFFKKFLIYKTIALWRANVRYHVYRKHRALLAHNLFIARPTFSNTLLEVNRIIYDMGKTPLIHHHNNAHTILSAQEFKDNQTSERARASQTLEQKVAELESHLLNVCTEVCDRARKYDESIASNDMSVAKHAQHLLRDGAKAMSMVSVREARQERLRKLKHAALEADMLGDLIRLVDYMQVSTLSNAAITSVAELLSILHEASRARRPLFQTAVSFGEKALSFKPDIDELTSMLCDTAEGAVFTAATADRVLLLPKLKPYISHAISDYLLVGRTVASDPIFTSCLCALENKVKVDFNVVSAVVSVIEKHRNVYDFGLMWNKSLYVQRGSNAVEWANEHGVSIRGSPTSNNALVEISVDEVEDDIELQTQRLENISNVKNSYEGGIFQAETKTLKGDLIPVVQNAIAGMKEYLLSRFRLDANDLREIVRELVRVLREDPNELALFAKHVSTYRSIVQDSKELFSKAREVEHVFALLEKHEVDVTIDSVQYEEVENLLTEFGEQLVACEQRIEEKMGVMKGQVYQRIAKLTSDFHSLRGKLLEGEFVSEKAKPDSVLVELKNVDETLSILRSEMAKVEEYQLVFGMDPYRFDEPLKDVTRTYERKHKFWSLYRDWLRLTGEWSRVDFSTLDVEKMNTTVRTMYATAHELSKQIRDKQGREVPVTVRLKRLILEYKTYMPVLLELGNPGMKHQHWREIFAAMGQTWTPEDHTLKKLRALNIFAYKDIITGVCESAMGEHALIESLQKVEDAWSKMNLIVVPYHKQPDVSILGDLEDVTVLLEEHQMVVQGMLGSQYVKAVLTQVEEWEKRLSTMSEVLDEWVTCQRGWMYMEPIFTAPDIQRQLPVEAKQFAEIDRQWRALMRRTKKTPNVLTSCLHTTLLASLKQHNQSLEAIGKHLEEYLEVKRSTFPRFYFLSNDELLTILSESRDVDAVQHHLRQCFDNIQRLVLSDLPAPETITKPNSNATPARDIVRAVLGMVSAEGEIVPLAGNVLAFGGAEGWLSQIERVMRLTIRGLLKRALTMYPHDTPSNSTNMRGHWLLHEDHCAQVLTTADQIIWTQNSQKAIEDMKNGNPRALQVFLEFTRNIISEMVGLIRGNLTPLQRQLLANLLIIDVHNRDVIEELTKVQDLSLTSFEWNKHLRYYWSTSESNSWVLNQNTKARKHLATQPQPDASTISTESSEINVQYDVNEIVEQVLPNEDCTISQLAGIFPYRYEYLGNATRLVMTALTDKCYLTLTGALAMNNGGAPQGPAGTGKTETVKDLGKAMANQVVVFNCSDGLEVHTMSRFFSGLCQAGAWACFDEFNRIDIEVLSVIAQQIMTIQTAIMQSKAIFEFHGRTIPLDPSFGVFITMNPGYAGRTELPDNLKALFRPISMMVPDYSMIAQIMLFSQGFLTAPTLANKMVQLYKLASEQLSKQDHYDFGMRAVKSVLVMAGALKRQSPGDSEDVVLIRAMRDSNIPKFKEDDIPLFQGIISDLFPGVNVDNLVYPVLEEKLKDYFASKNLYPEPALISKVIQLHETIKVRTGVMLVGEAMTGKSTCLHALAYALGEASKVIEAEPGSDDDLYIKPVTYHILNPKSITISQMYGSVSTVTNEWTDGLVSDLVRNLSADRSTDRKWVVFDGPVDALWVENLNTVLDDNKMLCLVNSERIRLTPQMNILFEAGDLLHASPATVSRCGMVYLESTHLPCNALLHRWLVLFRKQHHHILPSVSDWLFAVLTAVIPDLISQSVGLHVPLQVLDNQVVTSALHLFNALAEPVLDALKPVANTNLTNDEDNDDEVPVTPVVQLTGCDRDTLRSLTLCLYVALTWSFGARIAEQHRNKFCNTLRSVFVQLSTSDTVTSPLAAGLSSPLTIISEVPSSESAYDLYISSDYTSLVQWSTLVPQFVYNPEAPFHTLIVPTPESVCMETLLTILLKARRNVLIAGETGTGKSIAVDTLLLNNEATHLAINVQMCGGTKPEALVEALEFRLEKKGRKTILGVPRGGRTGVVLYIDDLNMPSTEQYGTQPPLELLRQLCDQGGYYDFSRKKPFFKHIQDTTYMATMAPVGGGRTEPSTRLSRHYHMLWLRQLAPSSMISIYSQILHGFLSNNLTHLQADLNQLTTALVTASVDLYTNCKRSLLPIPTKPHYTFNLRDLSKLIQGMTQVRKVSIPDTSNLVRLWIHEASRVFRDRLVDEGDRSWFDRQCQQRIQEQIGLDWSSTMYSDIMFGDFVVPFIPPGMDVSSVLTSERHYEELSDMSAIQTQLEAQLEEYNLVLSTSLNLVFFKTAIQHLARISRILRQPRGHALLVGVGGSGRQSLTRLAAFLSDYSCVSIEVSVGYGITEWRDSLKQLLENAAFGPQPCVFLLNDDQLQDAFLEDINSLVNKGEISGLYTSDEWDNIILKARQPAKKAGFGENREASILYFNHLVRERLHVVLALSNEGDTLRERLRMYPGLVNCCSIDWFNDWPQEALLAVAKQYFTQAAARSGVHAEETSSNRLSIDEHTTLGEIFAAYRDKLSEVCVEVHLSVVNACGQYKKKVGRNAHVTPTSFIYLLDKYVDILTTRREYLVQQLTIYRNGVNQLKRTNTLVNELRSDLIKLQPVLQQSATETAALLIELEKEEKEAQSTRRICQAEAAETEIQTRQVAAIAQDCETDLAEAMPAMDAAQKSLAVLRRDHINILKSLPHPPQLIKTLMESVCILFNQPIDWDSAKRLLSRPRFIESCRDYDKDNISQKTLKKIQKYVQMDDFKPEKMESVSEAAVSLCLWVRALDVYARVYANVEPKRIALAKARERLELAERKLHEQQEQVRLCEARVSGLQDKLQRKENERIELEQSMQRTSKQVERAQTLLTSLAMEGVRWEEVCTEYQAQVYSMCGDTLISSAIVNYSGVFTHEYREQLTKQWMSFCQQRGIPLATVHVENGFSLQAALGDPLTIRTWTSNSLPNDNYSIDSAIITVTTAGSSANGTNIASASVGTSVSGGVKWPLLIDPQGQATSWIKALYKSDNIQVATIPAGGANTVLPNSTDKPWRSVLENCIRFGIPVLLECESDELDGALDPILNKQIYKRSGQWVCRFGSQEIPYSPGFKLFLTTKTSNPNHSASTFAKCCVINFGVMRAGVEDQLLGIACSLERSALEQRADTLLFGMSADKQELREKEHRVLQLLQESGGHILEDEEVMQTLTSVQDGAKLVVARVAEAEKTMQEIVVAREAYRNLASHGAMLYMWTTQLASIDHMYQYSLHYFTSLFSHVLNTTRGDTVNDNPSTEQVQERVEFLITELTWSIFSSVARGVYVRDRALIALLLALHTATHRKDITDAQMNYLINPPSMTNDTEVPPNPSFIDTNVWKRLVTASTTCYPQLKSVISELSLEATTPGVWASWIQADEVRTSTSTSVANGLPHGNSISLSNITQLLLVRLLKPQCFVDASQRFITKVLGSQFIQAQPNDIAQCYRDSTPNMPTVFLISPGADPLPSILGLGDTINSQSKNGHFQVQSLSMGQGQGAKAIELIERSKREGHWVILQNCHLCLSFMPILENIVAKTARETDVHPNYRLWLTSLPSKGFSVSVLQNSLKVTTEMPRGVINAILQAYTDMGPVAFQYSENNTGILCEGVDLNIVYRRVVFALTALHAVMVERKKYQGLGWNVKYEWMWTDLYTCVEQVRRWCNEVSTSSSTVHVPWNMIQYMIGQIHYGGRVTDDKDQRCVGALVDQFVSHEVIFENAAPIHLAVDEKEQPIASLYLPDSKTVNSIDSIVAYCSKLTADAPCVFGLHSTAATTVALLDTTNMLSQLQSAIGSQTISGTYDETTLLSILDNMEQIIPKPVPEETLVILRDCISKCASSEAPMIVFARQEIERLNKLIAVISASLVHARQALKGVQVMSAGIEDVVKCLVQDTVPTAWATFAYPSCYSLYLWMKDLSKRATQYTSWSQHLIKRHVAKETDDDDVFVYWMSGLFFPQGFLTAVLQTCARINNIPVDTLYIHATILDETDSVVSEHSTMKKTGIVNDIISQGVVLKGLWLQGAKWDKDLRILVEPTKEERYSALPLVHVCARVITEDMMNQEGMYNCPIYKTTERAGVLSTTGHSTNFITTVTIPCPKERPQSHWIKRGSAIILENNDTA